MNTTTDHTAKCLRCGRVRRFRSATAAAKAQPVGRICAMRIRLAALAEAVKGFASAQVEKARELISDGGLIPTSRPGIFRAASSDGERTYLVHPKMDNCPSGLRDRGCYHKLAARILVASGKAA